MNLNEFLVKAKKNTYASNKKATSLEDGSKEFTYQEGNLTYRDRFFGNNPFFGEEIVFENGVAIWGMNYHGRVFDNDIDMIDKVYSFLKEALKKVDKRFPVRGPEEFSKGKFLYTNEYFGQELEFFLGREYIEFGMISKLVYELSYHGGLIKK